jgi:hypothetical protein
VCLSVGAWTNAHDHTTISQPPPTTTTTQKKTGIPCDLRDQSCFWTDVCAAAGFSNLLLFLFNLFIPAYPLDACRILVDFFALCKVRRCAALRCAALRCAAVAWAWVGLGVLVGWLVGALRCSFLVSWLIRRWLWVWLVGLIR